MNRPNAHVITLSLALQTKHLEKYVLATNWIRSFIPLYAQKIQPLMQRKTAMLAQGRESGATGSKSKRKRFTSVTPVGEVTTVEQEAFDLMQQNLREVLTLKLIHADDERRLFLKTDASKERGFSAVLFHYTGSFDPARYRVGSRAASEKCHRRDPL